MANRNSTQPSIDPRSATDLDRQIGDHIRKRRLEIGMSQEQLADTIGVSFQQIQKYETGTNRVAASKLMRIANALTMPVTLLLPGCTEADSAQEEPAPQEVAKAAERLTGEGRKLLLDIARVLISQPAFRRKD